MLIQSEVCVITKKNQYKILTFCLLMFSIFLMFSCNQMVFETDCTSTMVTFCVCERMTELLQYCYRSLCIETNE